MESVINIQRVWDFLINPGIFLKKNPKISLVSLLHLVKKAKECMASLKLLCVVDIQLSIGSQLEGKRYKHLTRPSRCKGKRSPVSRRSADTIFIGV